MSTCIKCHSADNIHTFRFYTVDVHSRSVNGRRGNRTVTTTTTSERITGTEECSVCDSCIKSKRLSDAIGQAVAGLFGGFFVLFLVSSQVFGKNTFNWRTEHEDYIEEVVKWSEDLKSPVTMFLGRCAYDKVRPHLNFKNYNCLDKYSAQLFLPLFLERYKHQQLLPCEQCGQEANRLFIKIQSEEKPQLSVRHVGHVAQQLPYTGLAIPHAYCDECALKKCGFV